MTTIAWILAGLGGLAAAYCALRLALRRIFPADTPPAPADTRYRAVLLALGLVTVLGALFALGEIPDDQVDQATRFHQLRGR
jgi:hypothetical protein